MQRRIHLKKIDLHIHTIPTISDAPFEFSIKKLKEYTEKQKIDCIAITNHNKFDLSQYNEIVSNLDIIVFPGIEINLENGHLLLISDNDELDDFTSKCQEIERLIQYKEDNINVEKLKEIFPNLTKYILIPHYDKKPSLNKEAIHNLTDYIKAGEVSSIKKFIYRLKDSNSLVPVVFSDCRLTNETTNFPTKQTYIDLNAISFDGLKLCLNDKNKIALSEDDGNKLFQVTNNLYISTGLTVILGERSSGKTYTLETIKKENFNVKYIEQFSLLKKDEKSFNNKISTQKDKITEEYLAPFKKIVEDINDIDIEKNHRQIEQYISSLLKYATETETADNFSKCIMYNENKFNIKDLNNLKKIIDSTLILIENNEYSEIIELHLNKDNLKKLLIDLIKTLHKEHETILKQNWLNSLINDIKTTLHTHSSQTSVEEINLYKIILDNKKIEKFNTIVDFLKNEKEIYKEDIGKFQIVGKTQKYKGAQHLKSKSSSTWAFSNAFSKYNSPYYYLQELKKISENFAPTEYYKYFIDIEYKILNNFGFEVSGGERAEFNLLNEIKDALKHDIFLIDEPESSFDNLFLKNEVNKLLKELSQKIPIVIVTHNNTVGASIKPDYVLYTKREFINDNIEYKIYSGYPSDKKLKCNNSEIDNYLVFIDCLEAGENSYNERRKDLYEILKD